MPSMIRSPVAARHFSNVVAGKMLAGGHALLQRREVRARAQRRHGAIRGRRREAHRRAEVLDSLKQLRWRRLLEEHGRCAIAHRENEDPAEAVRERERRRAAEDVVARRAKDVSRKQVADRQDVAMEVHRPFGLARCPGRERNEGDVIGRGGEIRERRRLGPRQTCRASRRHPSRTRRCAGATGRSRRPAANSWRTRASQSASETFAFSIDVRELARPQQRHRAHDDTARLEDGKPARRHHRIVRTAQQHAIARSEREVLHQHVRYPVRVLEQLPICPRPAGEAQRNAVAVASIDRGIEQLGCTVQAIGVAQIAHRDLGPQLARRQHSARELIDVSGHAGFVSVPAITIF